MATPCEHARDRYRGVIHDTEDAVLGIRSDLEALRRQIAAGLPGYYGWMAGDASTGLFASDFEAALERWDTSLSSLIQFRGALTQAVNDLDNKLVVLRSRMATLDGMCATEAGQKIKFTEADIPF